MKPNDHPTTLDPDNDGAGVAGADVEPAPRFILPEKQRAKFFKTLNSLPDNPPLTEQQRDFLRKMTGMIVMSGGVGLWVDDRTLAVMYSNLMELWQGNEITASTVNQWLDSAFTYKPSVLTGLTEVERQVVEGTTQYRFTRNEKRNQRMLDHLQWLAWESVLGEFPEPPPFKRSTPLPLP